MDRSVRRLLGIGWPPRRWCGWVSLGAEADASAVAVESSGAARRTTWKKSSLLTGSEAEGCHLRLVKMRTAYLTQHVSMGDIEN